MNIRSVSLFSLLMVFCVLSFGAPAHAYRDRCPRHEVKTELISKRDKTKFRRASIDGINAYLNNHNRANGTVLAFVTPETLYIQSQYKYDVVDIGGGWKCVKLTDVRSKFHVAATITMPTDYKKGSCQYNLILNHEKRHLKEIYDFHEENTSDYARYLGIIARDVPIFKPVRTENELYKVQGKIQQYFENKFSQQVHKSFIELEKAQNKIDSPQEYIFNNRRQAHCDDEDQKKPNKKSFPNHILD